MHKSLTGDDYWNKNKNDIIDLYLNKNMTSYQIGDIYGCHGTTILSHLKQWNVSKIRPNAKYNVDIEFFDKIDTEEKAYYLGLLLADGHVSESCVMLTLKDRDIVEKYQKAIAPDLPIRVDRYGNFAYNITSKYLADSLRNKGLHNRKSYYLDFNKILTFIPDELMSHFVRGLFDGDGSIKYYKYDYIKKPQLHFGFTGLKNVVEFVKSYLNIKTKTVAESDITYTCVTSCHETIVNIYNILYNNASVYLERKHKTFVEIVNGDLQRL